MSTKFVNIILFSTNFACCLSPSREREKVIIVLHEHDVASLSQLPRNDIIYMEMLPQEQPKNTEELYCYPNKNCVHNLLFELDEATLV